MRPILYSIISLSISSFLFFTPVQAAEPEVIEATTISLRGKPHYPPDFKHFDYVNPDAPQGGEIVKWSRGTFDNFNPYSSRGDQSSGSYALNDALMSSSGDDLTVYYPLIAKSLSHTSDYSWIIFDIDERATFSDGKPIRPEDVKFSFYKLVEEGLPGLKQIYAFVDKVEVLQGNRIKFFLKEGEGRTRVNMLRLCGISVFPEHFWKDHRLDEPLKKPPVSSSAYVIADYEFGKYELLKRLDNYWARDLPVSKGQLTIDTIRIDYYLDETVAFEAFKAGKIDIWSEWIAKRWATDYSFPAIKDGRVIKQGIPHETPLGTSGYIFNMQRPVFQDLRVRKALTYLMDFEWMNKNLFYGQYERTTSYFTNTEYQASGLPSKAELEFLDKIRDKIPETIFTEEFKLPKTDGAGNNRSNLRQALRLFKQAGWEVKNQKLVNAKTGKQLKIEFLIFGVSSEKIAVVFQQALKKAGIRLDIRKVDTAQYQKRVTEYDFDMIHSGYQPYPYPGTLLRRQWHTENLKSSWQRNGLSDPAIDWLMDEVMKYQEDKDADKLLALGKAIDRVLTHSYYIIPGWKLSKYRVAYWDKFGRPKQTPKYSLGIGGTAGEYSSWWIDPAKVKALK